MGHIAPVNSVDFASGNSDYLVTSGRDRAVKIWQWRSKTVKLNIDLRKCGRGTGLLKQYLNQTSHNGGKGLNFDSSVFFLVKQKFSV